MSDIQLQKCQDYLNGKINYSGMHILYQTYKNKYIGKFGYTSSQKDSVKIILNNFCKWALKEF